MTKPSKADLESTNGEGGIMRKLAIVLVPLLLLVLVFVIATIGCGGEETKPTPTPTALFLEIIEPENESTVSTESIIVSGSTIPGAVVSILVDTEIEIADVDEQGNFSATVTLAEGPNYIEVLASDQEGNEEYSILVVLYIL